MQDDLGFGLDVAKVKLSPTMLVLMFEEADQDKDGRIDYQGKNRTRMEG